ncbi:hypothetical protein M3Y94_00354600 [Aphelenchoides besseyi]|nr:hypothetical protein M3Y94_00354600 [Aphelenchoides besseyi]KAI6235317.1 hypothetical protein M3Y95_00038800 [Aphelenchoides besseyi]
MKMQILNGRRFGSVEKFTEMILNDRRIANTEPDSTEITYIPTRHDMESTIPARRPLSTTIPSTLEQTPFAKIANTNSSSVGVAGQKHSSIVTYPRSIIKKPNLSQQPSMQPKSTNTLGPRNATDSRRPVNGSPSAQEFVYRPTADSTSSSAPTQKTYERLAEVYSASDDTAQFAKNLRVFISEHIPWGVWIGLAIVEIFLGLASLFIGALNLPMCEIQPLIPIYLLLSGLLLILHGLVRSFSSIPTPRPRRTQQRARSTLFRDLCVYAIEALVLLFMVISVILGAVWTYGARYVHFHEGLFEKSYCDQSIYWIAWWSVTIHLTVFGLVILAFIFILIYGSVVSS